LTCKPCREKRVQAYMNRGMMREEAEKRADQIMPLVEKALMKRSLTPWISYYIKKGFRYEKAGFMAGKLLKRIDKRMKDEKLDYIPLYLLERVGEGVKLYYRKKGWFEQLRKRLYPVVFQWCFKTAWRATIFWTFKKKTLTWIGQGFNPDYTQNCTIGTCAKDTSNCRATGAKCSALLTCWIDIGYDPCLTTGTCGCPAPSDPNSSQVSGCTNPCTASGFCGDCIDSKCTANTCAVACLPGTCGYNCNPGWVWNGVQCVPAAVTQPYGDGFFFVQFYSKKLRKKIKVSVAKSFIVFRAN